MSGVEREPQNVRSEESGEGDRVSGHEQGEVGGSEGITKLGGIRGNGGARGTNILPRTSHDGEELLEEPGKGRQVRHDGRHQGAGEEIGIGARKGEQVGEAAPTLGSPQQVRVHDAARNGL